MNEQQFAQRLLALLNRNPNINLAEYFRDDPVYQELIRTTQFRHYRADEPSQPLKLLIPALIEEIGVASPGLIEVVNNTCPSLIEVVNNTCPSLIEKKEIFVPALIQFTKAQYGAVAILLGKFKFYDQFPEELCNCKKWMPTSNGCVLTCNGEGMFDTQEECENFRNNGTPENSTPSLPIRFYYAVRGNNVNTWVSGRLNNASQEFGPSVNLFVPKSGNTTMVRQIFDNSEQNQALQVRWLGEDGNTYFNDQVDLYYIGAEKYYRLDNGFFFQLEFNGAGYLGTGGFVNSSDPRSRFKSINFCWPENPITKWGLGGAQAFYQTVDPTQWFGRGILISYQAFDAPPFPPILPGAPQPYPNTNGKYWGLELFLGGDREIPISLGEFLINSAPLPDSTTSSSTVYQINFDDREWYQQNNLLLPDWMQVNLDIGSSQWSASTATITYQGNDKNRHANFRFQDWAQIPNIRAYAVKLSENETEVVVKYSTFRKFKRLNQGITLYDVMWCEIAVIKVTGNSINRRNFKFPQTVECDPRNWAAPYIKNWFYEQIADQSPGALPEQRLSQYSDTGGNRSFFAMQVNYGQFARPEMARYLFANTGARDSGLGTLSLRGFLGNQGWESHSYPINPNAMHTKGVNFNFTNNKLYAWDVKPNQSITINKTDRTYTLPLLDAIKFQTIEEAYIRYGELKRPVVPSGVLDSYVEGSQTNPVPHTTMFGNSSYWSDRTFSFSGVPKTAKTKIYKIPDDCFVIEATAFIDPAKLEYSSIFLPPQLYQSVFSYTPTGENEAPINQAVIWLDNNFPNSFAPITAVDAYQVEVGILARMRIYNKTNNQSTILLGCGTNQISLPPRIGGGTSGYSSGIAYDPILRGYCP